MYIPAEGFDKTLFYKDVIVWKNIYSDIKNINTKSKESGHI